jgi:hypothetical protein
MDVCVVQKAQARTTKTKKEEVGKKVERERTREGIHRTQKKNPAKGHGSFSCELCVASG